MRFVDYLKDKIVLIFLYILVLILIFLILLVFDVYYTGILMIIFLLIFLGLFIFLYRFLSKKVFYNKIYSILNNIDNKALIHEMAGCANFLEGKILLDILRWTDKYKIEEINKYKYMQKEFEEFMELWVHEVKSPLAAINLITDNNKNKVTNSIKEECIKIDDLALKILFYARSQVPEKDYLVKNVLLSDIVNKVIIRNKNSFLEKKVRVDIKNLDVFVFTDSKWMGFIINQIILNSIKYINDKALIEIYSLKEKENVCLVIRDNGIGISSKDLPRVFEKGFTGKNGRNKYNSTGMGLYLVKKLSDSLGNKVLIDSVEGNYTEVRIIFPLSSFTSEVIGR